MFWAVISPKKDKLSLHNVIFIVSWTVILLVQMSPMYKMITNLGCTLYSLKIQFISVHLMIAKMEVMIHPHTWAAGTYVLSCKKGQQACPWIKAWTHTIYWHIYPSSVYSVLLIDGEGVCILIAPISCYKKSIAEVNGVRWMMLVRPEVQCTSFLLWTKAFIVWKWVTAFFFCQR